jgi:inner membrane protein
LTPSKPVGSTSTGWRTKVLAPPPSVVVCAAGLFAVDQYAYQQAGSALLPQAPLDWTAHLLTTLFIVWAVKPLVNEAQLVPALIASVVIDADHIPGELGSQILTGGTQRPYTHSLTTVVVLLLLAAARPEWRNWASGAALGVASHLWRDLAEPQTSSVSLFWPVSSHGVNAPAAVYLGSIGLFAVIALARSRGRSRSVIVLRGRAWWRSLSRAEG